MTITALPTRAGAQPLPAHRGKRVDIEKRFRQSGDHNRVIQHLARLWAPPLLIMFSVMAILYLTAPTISSNLDRWQRGLPLDYASIAGSFVTFAIIVGMDLTFFQAVTHIKAYLTNPEKGGHPWLWSILAGVISITEALTFGATVAGYEHPVGWMAWGLLGLRSAIAPICAAVLAVAGNPAIAKSDILVMLRNRAGQALYEALERLTETGQADLGALMDFFLLVSDPVAMQQNDWHVKLEAAVARLNPLVVNQEHQQQLAAMRGQVEAAERRAQAAEAAVDDGVSAALHSSLMHLLTNKELPPHILELCPDLEGIDFSAAAGRGRGTGARNAAPRVARTRADRQRQWLRDEFDIEPAQTPTGKRGVYLRASDIAALSDGRCVEDTARSVLRSTEATVTIARGLAAPFDLVMRELMQRNLLADNARIWWLSSEDGARNSEENAVA